MSTGYKINPDDEYLEKDLQQDFPEESIEGIHNMDGYIENFEDILENPVLSENVRALISYEGQSLFTPFFPNDDMSSNLDGLYAFGFFRNKVLFLFIQSEGNVFNLKIFYNNATNEYWIPEESSPNPAISNTNFSDLLATLPTMKFMAILAPTKPLVALYPRPNIKIDQFPNFNTFKERLEMRLKMTMDEFNEQFQNMGNIIYEIGFIGMHHKRFYAHRADVEKEKSKEVEKKIGYYMKRLLVKSDKLAREACPVLPCYLTKFQLQVGNYPMSIKPVVAWKPKSRKIPKKPAKQIHRNIGFSDKFREELIRNAFLESEDVNEALYVNAIRHERLAMLNNTYMMGDKPHEFLENMGDFPTSFLDEVRNSVGYFVPELVFKDIYCEYKFEHLENALNTMLHYYLPFHSPQRNSLNGLYGFTSILQNHIFFFLIHNGKTHPFSLIYANKKLVVVYENGIVQLVNCKSLAEFIMKVNHGKITLFGITSSLYLCMPFHYINFPSDNSLSKLDEYFINFLPFPYNVFDSKFNSLDEILVAVYSFNNVYRLLVEKCKTQDRFNNKGLDRIILVNNHLELLLLRLRNRRETIVVEMIFEALVNKQDPKMFKRQLNSYQISFSTKRAGNHTDLSKDLPENVRTLITQHEPVLTPTFLEITENEDKKCLVPMYGYKGVRYEFSDDYIKFISDLPGYLHGFEKPYADYTRDTEESFGVNNLEILKLLVIFCKQFYGTFFSAFTGDIIYAADSSFNGLYTFFFYNKHTLVIIVISQGRLIPLLAYFCQNDLSMKIANPENGEYVASGHGFADLIKRFNQTNFYSATKSYMPATNVFLRFPVHPNEIFNPASLVINPEIPPIEEPSGSSIWSNLEAEFMPVTQKEDCDFNSEYKYKVTPEAGLCPFQPTVFRKRYAQFALNRPFSLLRHEKTRYNFVKNKTVQDRHISYLSRLPSYFKDFEELFLTFMEKENIQDVPYYNSRDAERILDDVSKKMFENILCLPRNEQRAYNGFYCFTIFDPSSLIIFTPLHGRIIRIWVLIGDHNYSIRSNIRHAPVCNAFSFDHLITLFNQSNYTIYKKKVTLREFCLPQYLGLDHAKLFQCYIERNRNQPPGNLLAVPPLTTTLPSGLTIERSDINFPYRYIEANKFPQIRRET